MSRVRISQFCSFPTDVQNYKPTIFDLKFTSSPNRGHTRSGRESTKNRHEKSEKQNNIRDVWTERGRKKPIQRKTGMRKGK
jgi:hypothetical protein